MSDPTRKSSRQYSESIWKQTGNKELSDTQLLDWVEKNSAQIICIANTSTESYWRVARVGRGSTLRQAIRNAIAKEGK